MQECWNATSIPAAIDTLLAKPTKDLIDAGSNALIRSGLLARERFPEERQPTFDPSINPQDVSRMADSLGDVADTVLQNAVPLAFGGHAVDLHAEIASHQPMDPTGVLAGRVAMPPAATEKPQNIMEHAQAYAADLARRQGGDSLDQVVAATHVNATLGAHYDAAATEMHHETRQAQVAEEMQRQAESDAQFAREAALNQAADQAPTAGGIDAAFADREQQIQSAKDEDFAKARNQLGDQAIARGDDLAAGVEKGGADEPGPTLADTLAPEQLAAFRTLAERRRAEMARGADHAAVVDRIKEDSGETILPFVEPKAGTPKGLLGEPVEAAPESVTEAPKSLAERRAEVLENTKFSNTPEAEALTRASPEDEPAPALADRRAAAVEAEQPKESAENGATKQMVSLAQRRAAAEESAKQEGNWQRLMSASPEAAKDLVSKMPIEEAQAHLERLDAAPGDNETARAALEDRVEPQTSAADVEAAAHEAATSPKNDLEVPTEAQQNAGNFKMGKVDVQGLPISIEHPEGATRPSGMTPRGAHYGYVRGTVDADGMHTDVLLGKHPENDQAFIVDHLDPSGEFQQHKLLVGFQNKLAALRAYRSLFKDNPLGPVSEVHTDALKEWLKNGDTTKPYDQRAVNRLADTRPRFSTAEAKPTHPEEVTHTASSGGDGRVLHQYRYGEGRLDAMEDRDAGVTKVLTANAGPMTLRGRGVGTSMLERAVNDAHARGQRFESDTRVSKPQQGTYASLKDRGYDVRENPNQIDSGTGERISKSDLRGTYEVRPKAQNHVEADAQRAQPFNRLEAARTLQPFTDKYGNQFEVHQDSTTLPDNIRDAMRSGNHDNHRGVFDPDSGQIHIVAGAHESHEELLRTAAHEVAHKGLDHLFEDDEAYQSTMADVYRGATDKAWLRDYADQHDIDVRTKAGRALVADEYAAHLAEHAVKDPNIWRRVVDGVRAGLRKLGVVKDWNDDDIRALVRSATSKLIDHLSDFAEDYRAKGIRFADKESPPNVPSDSEEARAYKYGRMLSGQEDNNPGFIKSRTDFAKTMEEQSGYNPGRVGKVRDWVKDKVGDLKDTGLATIPLRNLKDFNASRRMPDVAAFIKTHDTMAGRRGQILESRGQTVRQWAKWGSRNKEMNADLGELTHSSTLMGVDPSKPFEARYEGDPSKADLDAKRKAYYDVARKVYNSLDSTGQRLYRQVRDDYAENRQMKLAALEQRIKGVDASEEAKKNLLDSLRAQFERGKVESPYFPLQRFGNKWAAARDKDGNMVSFSRFESQSQKKAWLKEMDQAGYKVTGGERLDDIRTSASQIDPKFVKRVLDRVNEVDPTGELGLAKDVWDEYLRSLPELSARKHFITRQGRLGYSIDAARAYAYNSQHEATQIAKLEYGNKLSDHLEKIQQQAQALNDEDPTSKNALWGNAVAREMGHRLNWINNHSTAPWASALTRFGSLWYLGFAPSTAVRILLQNFQNALPALAAHHGGQGAFGFVRGQKRAAQELGKAMVQWVGGRGELADGLRGDERNAFDVAKNTGVFSSTMLHDVAGVGGGADINSRAAKFAQAAGWMFQKMENINRQSAFIAGYRLARQDGMSHEAAIDHASDMSNRSHFDYSTENRPRFMQGNIAKVATLFQTYPLGMMYRLARDARDSVNKSISPEERSVARQELAGMMMHTAVLWGGVAGVGAGWAARSVINMFLGDDEKLDSQQALQHYLEKQLGSRTANMIMHGAVPGLIRASLHSDFADLGYKSSDRDQKTGDWFKDQVLQRLGPLYDLGKNWVQGVQNLMDGQIERGVEHFAPHFAQGPLKAYRYSQEGVKDAGGNTILGKDKLDNWDIAKQFLGFEPEKVENAYATNNALKNAKQEIQTQKSSLEGKLRIASAMGDDKTLAEVVDGVQRFNAAHPGDAITSRDIIQSAREQARKAATSLNGVDVPRGLQQELKNRYGGETQPAEGQTANE
jgi:hypothetical protein